MSQIKARQDQIKIAVTGATGFVGSQLISQVKESYPNADLIGISRRKEGHEVLPSGVEIEWRKADLFSLLDIENALEGVDVAYYLVHSMSPSAGLVQGSFDELDLLLADNFAKAAKKAELKKMIYLGGLLPDGDIQTWSTHLKSRYEVEEILKSSGVPVYIFRAGLVVGAAGSSFEILKRLVLKLPVMLCPKWTASQTSAVSLNCIVDALSWPLDRNDTEGAVIDLGETFALSYKQMMEQMSLAMGKTRYFFPVPFLSPKLSRLWVGLVTRAPKDLVYPLVMSLKHSLLPRYTHPEFPEVKKITFHDLAKETISQGQSESKSSSLPHAYQGFYKGLKSVRSVQRIDLPKVECREDKVVNAETLALEYLRWLPRFLSPFLKVRHSKHSRDIVGFYFFGIPCALLILARSSGRSTIDRQLFYIKGGLLARPKGRGRLEFRVLEGPKVLITAIHDFYPALPWRVYKYSQALIHLFVMTQFGRHVCRKYYTKFN